MNLSNAGALLGGVVLTLFGVLDLFSVSAYQWHLKEKYKHSNYMLKARKKLACIEFAAGVSLLFYLLKQDSYYTGKIAGFLFLVMLAYNVYIAKKANREVYEQR